MEVFQNLKKEKNGKLRIIPLGGLEQIGMNITAFEYEDSIVAVSYTHLDVYKRQIQVRGQKKRLWIWQNLFPFIRGRLSSMW